MPDNSWAATKIATDEDAIISSTLSSGQNTPSIANEVDLNNLNNEQMLQYIKRLQATLEQYKTWEEASFMNPKVKEDACIDTPRTRAKTI